MRAPADRSDHRATRWFRKATPKRIGLQNARFTDRGDREGLLKAGNRDAMYSGGSGITESGVVVRWGRE